MLSINVTVNTVRNAMYRIRKCFFQIRIQGYVNYLNVFMIIKKETSKDEESQSY